jgi:hypothetical protein
MGGIAMLAQSGGGVLSFALNFGHGLSNRILTPTRVATSSYVMVASMFVEDN